MPDFACNVGTWDQKEWKMCLRNKSMAQVVLLIFILLSAYLPK